jgi:hypothetical protein
VVDRLTDMKRVATHAHRSGHPNPVSFDAGATLAVGGRISDEYPGWVWARTVAGNAGWVPESILGLGDDGTARATEADTARELDANVGEVLTVIRESSGWCWGRNSRGDEGWIPVDKTQQVGC